MRAFHSPRATGGLAAQIPRTVSRNSFYFSRLRLQRREAQNQFDSAENVDAQISRFVESNSFYIAVEFEA
jgi:hypothetical protein